MQDPRYKIQDTNNEEEEGVIGIIVTTQNRTNKKQILCPCSVFSDAFFLPFLFLFHGSCILDLLFYSIRPIDESNSTDTTFIPNGVSQNSECAV